LLNHSPFQCGLEACSSLAPFALIFNLTLSPKIAEYIKPPQNFYETYTIVMLL
jgi:hypothetical protein